MTTALRSAANITLVTLGSRVLGFARDIMMFWTLGYWAVGVFALAWMVPNMLRRFLGEGALAASFIPAYARAKEEHGKSAAHRLLASVSGLLLTLMLALCVLVVVTFVFLPAEWIGKASEEPAIDAATHGELLKQLTVILFPYSIPICLAALLTGALNTYGVFALPAAAPIVLNIFWIGGLGYANATGIEDPKEVVTLLAIVLLIGGFVQLLLSVVPLWKRRALPRPRWPAAGDPAFGVMRAMGPTVVGMSLLQLTSVLDQVLATYLVGPEAPGFIYQANRLLLFPHALTSLAVATAIFPRFANHGAKNDLAGLRKTADDAMHHTALVAWPAAIGMVFVAYPLITVMLSGSDKITPADIELASITTMCLVAALPMIGIAQLHARAFYALGEYRLPAWMSFWLLLLNLVLDLVLVVGFDVGVPGFAIATAAASAVNAIVLRAKFKQRCPAAPGTGHRTWPTLLASAVMGGLVYGTTLLFDAETTLELVLFDLLLPMGVGMASYAGLQFAFGRRSFRMR